jgi:hypothetical protein
MIAALNRDWQYLDSYDLHPALMGFYQTLRRMCLGTALLSLVGGVACAPLYILKILDDGESMPTYSTHTHMYMWLITASYITGTIPAALLMTAWLISLCLLLALYYRHLLTDGTARPSPRHKRQLPIYTTVEIVVFVVNIVVSGSMNALYIYSTTQSISLINEIQYQILLACFNLMWNIFICLYVNDVRLIVVMRLLNGIMIPHIATLLTSKSCLQVCFTPPSCLSLSPSRRT